MRLSCRKCHRNIANITELSIISDGPRRCHLVARRNNVASRLDYPHPESERKPFKLGKVRCSNTNCNENHGNIQKFTKMPGEPVFCALKYENVQFYDPVINTRHNVTPRELGYGVLDKELFKKSKNILPIESADIRALFPQHYDYLDSDSDAGASDIDDLNNQFDALGVRSKHVLKLKDNLRD